MLPDQITPFLNDIFGAIAEVQEGESWQIDTPEFRLLVLLSEDQSWLRVLLPIAPVIQVAEILPEILEANFDLTQETRYGINQNVLWGVFQHNLDSLTPADFSVALGRLVALHHRGLQECWRALIPRRLREIILAAKQQGQTLESTLQSLDRLYQEGVLGQLDQDRQSVEETLLIWRQQLETLWPEVTP